MTASVCNINCILRLPPKKNLKTSKSNVLLRVTFGRSDSNSPDIALRLRLIIFTKRSSKKICL